MVEKLKVGKKRKMMVVGKRGQQKTVKGRLCVDGRLYGEGRLCGEGKDK